MRAVLLVLALIASVAGAQDAPLVPASASVSWVHPTEARDGSALVGPQAITESLVYASTDPIPDDTAAEPVGRVAAPGRTFVHSVAAPNGSTLYFRVRSCNAGGCSDLSAQAEKPVRVSVPGVPSGVTVTVTVVLQVAP